MPNQKQKLLQKIIESSTDPKLIKKAYNFADKAHKGQKRQQQDCFTMW